MRLHCSLSTIPLLALALLHGFPGTGMAHMHVLIPERAACKVGDEARVLLFYGHPFEHEVLNAEPPRALKAHPPAGPALDLLPVLRPEKATGADGKEVTVFRFHLKPPERGDYRIAFSSHPRFEGEEEGFTEDHAKVVVHVDAERGWDAPVGQPLEVLPLTRPYGLRPGSTFLARAVESDGRPLEGAAVEIERYNPKPPASLPESPFITRTARTGPGGLIAASLDEAGWWGITVTRRQGTLPRDGKDHPLTVRSTLWVFVGEPLGSRR